MADYKTPQWLLPNEKNLAYPAAGDGITGSGLSEDRHSLYSMNFDGTTSDRISIESSDNILPLNATMSISAWIYMDTSAAGVGRTIFTNGKDNSGAYEYKFEIDTNDNLYFAVRTLSVSPFYTEIIGGTTISLNTWHHVAITWDGANLNLYLNGTSDTSPVAATSFYTSGANDAPFIGVRRGGASSWYSPWAGKLDEIAIWNKALNQSEINALSVADAPANIMALNEKPVAYYPLGEQAQMGSANWSFPNGSLQSHVVDFSTQDYIQYPHININGAFTISTWVKTTDTNTYGNLFSSSNQFGGDPSGGSSIANNWKLIRWNRSARFNASNSSNSIIFDVNTGTSGTRPNLYDGNWHHVLAIWDGTTNSNGVKIFFDGVLRGLGTASSTAINNDNSIPIRAGSSDTTFDFIGEQSNQQIWNTALTYGSASADGDVAGGDVANVYNNGSPQSTYTVTPTAWWKLNAANSSYVYPWSLELNGDPDVSGGGDHAKVVSNALQIKDIDSSGASGGSGGTVDFLTKEITGAYSGIDVTGEFTIATASSYINGATLYYKIDGGSWVQFQQQLDTSGTTTYAISGASGLTSTTSFQVKIEFQTGTSSNSIVTLNNISIGGLYTEDFTNQDGAGWDNDTYTPPPVDWTFIDTETPAPNYTSALDFVSADSDYIDLSNNSSLYPGTGDVSYSAWIKPSSTTGFKAIFGVQSLSTGAKGVNIQIYNGEIWVFVGVGVGGQWGVNTGGSTGGAGFITSGANLTLNKWHHIAFTFDRDGDGVIYINGAANRTAAANPNDYSSVDITGTANVFLGRGDGYFDGEISNAATFNTSLDAAAVSILFNSGTPQTSISSSPISWWKLDNTTTGIQDSGSASNNGTNNGATQIATNVLVSNNGESDTLPTSALTPSDLQFESPYSNYSLDFDGTSSFMGTTESILPSAGDMTVSAWVKLNDTTSLQGIFESANYYTTGFNGGFGLRTNGVGLSAAFSNGTSFVYNIEPAGFTIGDWFNVAFTFNNTSKLGTYYVNGSSIGTYTFNSAYDNADLVNGAELGRVVKNSGYILNGNLDEVSVFSSVLTQAQITQIYNNSYPADLTSLSPASWWRLGEDAYFVGNTVTIPNKVVGGATMSGNGTQTAILVGDAPGSYANGSGTNLGVTDRIGDAPESTANSVSINMIPSNRHSYPAGYVPTQVDNAFSMDFDGVNDYITSNTNGISGLNNASISVWVKPTGSTSNQYKSIVNQWEAANMAWGLWLNGSGSTYSIHWNQAGASGVDSGSIIPIDEWSHIAIVKNATTLKMFHNGSEVSSFSISAATGSGATTLNIGAQYGSTSALTFFNGNIDEVAIFDYALSARQIKQDIYEGTTTGGKTADLNNISNLTAPVAWYRMGD